MPLTFVETRSEEAHNNIEQLRNGTQAVKELLGPDSSATTKDIEDALWYYYFDIDKTAAYLLSKHSANPSGGELMSYHRTASPRRANNEENEGALTI